MQTHNELSQISLSEVSPYVLLVTIKFNGFKIGEIHLREKIFYSVPRTSKNLFWLPAKDEGCLCYNVELLSLDSYDLLKILYHQQVLTCPRKKFLEEGFRSPFSDHRVESQLCLPLSKINNMPSVRELQPDLFEEVVL